MNRNKAIKQVTSFNEQRLSELQHNCWQILPCWVRTGYLVIIGRKIFFISIWYHICNFLSSSSHVHLVCVFFSTGRKLAIDAFQAYTLLDTFKAPFQASNLVCNSSLVEMCSPTNMALLITNSCLSHVSNRQPCRAPQTAVNSMVSRQAKSTRLAMLPVGEQQCDCLA